MTIKIPARIFHPTDFSVASDVAFAHALCLAIKFQAELIIMHVAEDSQDMHWSEFPSVRSTLERWNLLPQGSDNTALAKLGVKVDKILSKPGDQLQSMLEFLEDYPSELIVLMTHQLDGLARLESKAIAEPLAREAGVSALFVPQGKRGFVALSDGSMNLDRILVPVDHEPSPQAAFDFCTLLIEVCGSKKVTFDALHVGSAGTPFPHVQVPKRNDWAFNSISKSGDVLQCIKQYEDGTRPDLIAMTSAGHISFMDGLRGSVSERVLRQANRPVLIVPSIK